MQYLLILLVMLVASCRSTDDHDHPHDDHAHSEYGHSEEEHHGDGHNEIPTLDTTIWTGRTELFVEFPVLVVGHSSRFAAHFTTLEGHQPVRNGTVTVRLTGGENDIQTTADAPSSPGIFTPSLQPERAGIFQLVFELNTPELTDRFIVDNLRVFPSPHEAAHFYGNGEENDGAITFLKEQAWKMEFQTAPVTRSELYEVINTFGVWKKASSGYKTIITTSDGTVAFGGRKLTEGLSVRKGEVLMTVSSGGLTAGNLSSEVSIARANLDQAQAEFDRKKQLFEANIVPEAEFEQVEQKYRIARSVYETVSAGYSGNGKQITVPFDGYIRSVSVRNGEFVPRGTSLVTIAANRTSLLESYVSPSHSPDLSTIQDIWYRPTDGEWSSLKSNGGSILSVGKEVHPDRPLLPVIAEVNEPVNRPEGSFTEVQLIFGSPTPATVIPEGSLLEDFGSYSVIVQLSGESFERRPVIIGKRNGRNVQIRQGLEPGEVVVTKGAFQVKMASMSGQAPAHGHSH